MTMKAMRNCRKGKTKDFHEIKLRCLYRGKLNEYNMKLDTAFNMISFIHKHKLKYLSNFDH